MAKKKISKNTSKLRIESVLEKSKYVEKYMADIIAELITDEVIVQKLEKKDAIPLRIKLREMFDSEWACIVQRIRIERLEFECDSIVQNIGRMIEIIQEREVEVKTAEDSVKKLEEQLKKARKDLEEANRRIDSSKKTKYYLEIQKGELEKELYAESEQLQIMQTTYLLHPSIKIEQLNRNQLGRFVCLEEDKPLFKQIIVDEVFNIDSAIRFVTHLPGDFYYKYQDEESRKSIIDYCDMVLNYMAEADKDHKIEALYYNDTIAQILELNS